MLFDLCELGVLGLVGAGGIGVALNTAIDLFYWDRVALVLITIFRNAAHAKKRSLETGSAFCGQCSFLALRLTPQWVRDRRQACRLRGRRLRGLSVARGLAAGAAGGRP